MDVGGQVHLLQSLKNNTGESMLRHWLWNGVTWSSNELIALDVKSGAKLTGLVSTIRKEDYLGILYSDTSFDSKEQTSQVNLSYQERVLEIPEIISALPTFTAIPTVTLEPTNTPPPPPTPTIILPASIENGPQLGGLSLNNTWTGLILGGGLALFLTIITFSIRVRAIRGGNTEALLGCHNNHLSPVSSNNRRIIMDQVKVGVIGVGRMGQRHCRVYSNMRKVHLIGVCDLDPELGRRIADQYEIDYYPELEALLEQVDAVSLATPTPLHFEMAQMCIASGVHTLIEKPISETLEQAEAIAKAADKSGLIVQVGHIERFNPAYIELKNVLDEMPPLAINLRRLSPYKGSNVDVDVVLDLMIHDTNLVLDLIGNEPIALTAYGLTAYSGMIDHAVAQCCFEEGPVLTMTASRLTEHKVRKIDVTCREAYLECDLFNKSLLIHRSTIGEYLNANKKGVKYRQESIVERINVPPFEPLFLQLQHFVDCVGDHSAPSVTARDGFLALKMVTDIRKSIQEFMVNMDRRKLPRNDQTPVTRGLEAISAR